MPITMKALTSTPFINSIYPQLQCLSLIEMTFVSYLNQKEKDWKKKRENKEPRDSYVLLHMLMMFHECRMVYKWNWIGVDVQCISFKLNCSWCHSHIRFWLHKMFPKKCFSVRWIHTLMIFCYTLKKMNKMNRTKKII